MAENNLFQFAQVITDLPVHSTSHLPHSEKSVEYYSRYPHVRKNACIVCNKCFTCSKIYGIDCACPELQPRRGKNLPQGTLDSRAKKLHKDDPDYEFSIRWLEENAHVMYRGLNGVTGLDQWTEVSLCKAHSSTLYRAKKRYERPPDGTMIRTTQSTKRPRSTTPVPRASQSMDGRYRADWLPPPFQTTVETVSLCSKHENTAYFFRNLAITDNFTFRDLLNEIDMTGTPPAGKRIVISDQEKLYPLDQPIRSVIKRPRSSHIELFLSVADKPSIDWNRFS
ncbi:hypothetical protein BY458DRAFT_504911 [Sporodiniella umbellata]|nr:hypothetical protein BY458DRAFT_504911 [Sporodiniella umbellata]